MARLNRYGIGRYYDVAAINLFTARPASVMRGVRYVRRSDATRRRAPQAGLADRVDLARRQGPRVAPGGLLAALLVHDRHGHGQAPARRLLAGRQEPPQAQAGAGRLVHVVVGLQRRATCSTTRACCATRAARSSSGRPWPSTRSRRVATRAAARPPRVSAASAAAASRSERAAACGSAASLIARTTTTRRAPAPTTSATLAASIPPIANQGALAAVLGRVTHVVEPGGRASRLGRGLPDRSHAQLVGLRRQRRVELLGRVGRQPDQQVGAELLARLGHGHVVLAEVHAVGACRAREVGPVVQPEQRAVLVAERAEAGRRAQDLLVGRVLVAQLDHVDPAAQRGAEHRLGRRLDDEVEPGSPQALARYRRAPRSPDGVGPRRLTA